MEGPAPLVSFPAGKMNRNGVTNMVEADPRRGVFQIVVTPDDMLTHLQWRPRGVSTPEDDLIIFPGEAELLPVQSCPGRVFVLKWKEGELRKFYWMQLADLDADAVFVESVNQILTEGPGVAQQAVEVGAANGDDVEMPSPSDESPAAPAPEATVSGGGAATGGGNSGITMNAFMQAMANAGGAPTGAAPVATPTIAELLEHLSEALTSEDMTDALPGLHDLLPDEDKGKPGAIREALRSPALRAQAASLTNAMASGGVTELLASFGLPFDASTPPAVGAAGLQAFFKSLRDVPRKSPPKKD